MKVRILAGVVAAAILLGALFMGQIAVTVLASIVAMIAVYEFVSVVFGYGAKQRKPEMLALMALALGNLMLTAYRPVLIGAGLVCSFIFIFIYNILHHRHEPDDVMYQMFALVYIALPLGMLIQMYSFVSGYLFVGLIFIIAVLTDTMAYFVGMKFGKRRLAPTISPKKSVEGAVGGFAGAIFFSILFGIILSKGFEIHLPWWHYGFVGAIGSIFGQFGDLSASLIKRKFHKKDYGNLIPGHGGILDRIDSVLFVVPVVYCYVYLVS